MDGPAGAQGLAAGTRFGRYAVVRPMAGGGMSEVYLGVDATVPADMRSPIAIKRLLPHMAWDADYVRMFLDEVRIAAGLEHPNIVRVLDFGMGDGGYYFAMEYVQGATVDAILRKASRLGGVPYEVAISIVLEVAAGLQYAHGTGLVHRDVSPSNVMVTHAGQVKLVDFGIARMRAHTRHTRAGTVKGKIGYMSPEQCRGRDVDHRSDVFGLGIILYELTVGRRAFYGDNDYAVLNRIVDGEYRAPEDVKDDYPPALSTIVKQALAVDPDERYRSAAALSEDLRALGFAENWPATQAFMAGAFGQPAAPALELPAAPSRWKGRALWAGGVAAAVALLTVGAYAAGGGFRGSTPAEGPAAAARDGDDAPAAIVEATPAVGKPDGARVDAQPAAAVPEPATPAPKVESAPPPARPRKKKARQRGKARDARRPADTKDERGGPGDALLPPSWQDK